MLYNCLINVEGDEIMGQVVKLLAQLVNNVHDDLIVVFNALGFNFSDKDMHFWVIGVIGMILFLITNSIFKWISKFSISALSFIYTFTVLVVLVFAVEIQQKITGRGNMELKDATVGLKGFLYIFLIYLVIVLSIKGLKWGYNKLIEKKQ